MVVEDLNIYCYLFIPTHPEEVCWPPGHTLSNLEAATPDHYVLSALHNVLSHYSTFILPVFISPEQFRHGHKGLILSVSPTQSCSLLNKGLLIQ